ncbi:hypothetical protein D0864_08063 [Hortaea werneckii]|uniref:Transcription initiation factor TFIID subunit 13 n=1 Tax=Hortaea werneckii TaxID=91943 RepID=A0A3M7F112_HORWE|nr:hypothetical protein D0864_08063 [Hortaea werneckii]
MTEPRPRHRARGQFFATPDLIDLLYAFGDNPHPFQPPSNCSIDLLVILATGPLPPTITTLSEILEDFLTETCHLASLSASYSRRQKIKVDDFKFVLREDEALLGRALEQLWKDRGLKEERRLMDVEKVGGGGAGGAAGGAGAGMEELGALAEMGGVGGEAKKKGKGRGRGGGRKRKVDVAGDEGGGEAKKKVKGEQGSP